ncbi:MAG: hypothetical protein KC419_22670 [Anaerolineales bacterium]|nr:hypothetical protein [Anaerolineales bacterium]
MSFFVRCTSSSLILAGLRTFNGLPVFVQFAGGGGEAGQPVSSPGIHLIVTLYSPLNPGGVLPVV